MIYVNINTTYENDLKSTNLINLLTNFVIEEASPILISKYSNINGAIHKKIYIHIGMVFIISQIK